MRTSWRPLRTDSSSRARTRIQLCGRFVLELQDRRIEAGLPSRQGRLLFAYLALNRDRAATRDELVEALATHASAPVVNMLTARHHPCQALADLLTLRAASRLDAGTMTSADAAMAKVYASEMLGRVCDAAVQIFGGMGLMSEMPVERWWRDARVDRIWDGTSEIQRHIIARSLLRPYGA